MYCRTDSCNVERSTKFSYETPSFYFGSGSTTSVCSGRGEKRMDRLEHRKFVRGLAKYPMKCRIGEYGVELAFAFTNMLMEGYMQETSVTG